MDAGIPRAEAVAVGQGRMGQPFWKAGDKIHAHTNGDRSTAALHSDAPLEPLTLAWAATNRVTINGNRTGQTQRISLEQALRAITVDAACVIGWEDEIGSIRADSTVLEQDPYEMGVAALREIQIWGTVFEGRPAPLQAGSASVPTTR
ncbi:MAG: amidohydrolase family protein [Pseudomonadota bacterium]